MPALPAERLRLRPRLEDQLHPFVGALARLGRIQVVGQRLVRRAAQETDDQAPLRHRIEHRDLFGHAHRIALRHDRTEQCDLDLLQVGGQERRGDDRRRGQDPRRVVMLGDADPVEAEILDELEPLDHAAIGASAGLGVVDAGRHRPFRR
jgi:hypothetical protein